MAVAPQRQLPLLFPKRQRYNHQWKVRPFLSPLMLAALEVKSRPEAVAEEVQVLLHQNWVLVPMEVVLIQMMAMAQSLLETVAVVVPAGRLQGPHTRMQLLPVPALRQSLNY